MKFHTMLAMVLCSAGLAVQAEVTVSNLVVVQRSGSKLVDITYDVHSTETNAVTVSLMVSDGVQIVSSTSLSGDVGEGVSTGLGKSIVWNAGVDWDGNVAVLSYSLQADGRKYPCPVAKTGQTTSGSEGDDGDLQTGVAWPDPRFSDNGDGTVLDHLTKLEWIKIPHLYPDFNINGKSWSEAIDFCNDLTYAEHSDWRLPTMKELESMVSWGQEFFAEEWLNSDATPFLHIQYADYWTSTSLPASYNVPGGSAWMIDMGTGNFGQRGKSSTEYVWPVRGVPDLVSKTGQTISYQEGDDGDLKSGIEWPNPRFVEHGYDENEIITDMMTGLEWGVDGALGSFEGLSFSEALDYCNNLTLGGYSDWRLPNRKELLSIVVHYSDGRAWLAQDIKSSIPSSDVEIMTSNGNLLDRRTGVLVLMNHRPGYVLPVRAGLSSSISDSISVNNITDTRAIWTPADELIAFFPFDGSADDESGNGHDGTVLGAVLTQDRYGNLDSAYQFDGVNDHIVIPDHADFTVTDATVAAWVLTSDKSDYKHITSCYGKDVGSQWYNLYITSGSGTARWQVDSGGISPFSLGTTDIADDSWHLIVGVRDTSAAQLKIYVDGVLGVVVPDSSTDALDPAFDFWIGGQNGWPARYFNGVIDDVRIYSRALSEPEVRQLADSDLDQLSDADEVNIYGTDPSDADSDNDGLSDSEELGVGNYCLKFDGINDYVSVEAAVATNTFTVEFWVNATEAHQIDQELNFGVDGVVGQKYALFPNPQGMGVSIGTNGISVYEHQANYMPPLVSWAGSVSGWTHIAVVYDDKTPSLYVNGYWVRTGLLSPKDTTTPSFKIGGGGYGYLKGKMDELRVWDHARSASDLLNGMHAVLTGSESGLLRLYKFDHSSGSVLEDLAENANGTLYNMSDADWCLSGVRFGTDPLNEDSDGDSIPDGWEVSNGLDAMGNDAGADEDGDTLSNLQEYIIGTDPQDIHSFIVLSTTGEPRVPGNFDMECTTVTGRQYTVEYKNTLIEGDDWEPFTNFSGSGDSVYVADENIVSNRFFRVKVVKP